MTTMDSPERTWRVTSQQRTAEAVPGGTVARGWLINWRTGGNVDGQTFVPDPDSQDIAKVQAAVHRDAMLAYDRSELTHQ
jgi:hypothetical protein